MTTLYLLHFDRPYVRAQHYMGATDNLQDRLETHQSGNGARLMQVIAQAGITFQLARTWEDTHDAIYQLERKLKRQKHHWRLCPVCRATGRKP